MTTNWVVVSNELCHHGILGQKWGKRNGPPYPLGASDHSASEKKAGWKKSLNRVEKDPKKSYNRNADEWKKAGKIAAISAIAVIGGAALYKSGILNKELIDSGKDFVEEKSRLNIDLQFFAKRSDDLEPIRLPFREYKHVQSEIMTHCVDELKTQKVFTKRILHDMYTVRNHFDGTFDIVGKQPIVGDIWDYLEELEKGE